MGFQKFFLSRTPKRHREYEGALPTETKQRIVLKVPTDGEEKNVPMEEAVAAE